MLFRSIRYILFIFALLLMPAGYAFADETLQQKIQNILNDKTTDDHYVRFKTAYDTVGKYNLQLPFEEVMPLYDNVLLSFAEKKITDKRKLNMAKAYIYNNISAIYEVRGDPGYEADMEAFMTKAIEFADLSEDNAVRKHTYRNYGYFQSTYGSVQLAHEYLYKAIALNETLNNYNGIFDCLYLIAENLLQTRDITGLRKVMEQMQQVIEKPAFDGNPRCFYDLYSIQGVYFTVLFEDNPEITAYNDSALMAMRKTIHVAEKNRGRLDAPVGFVYYNMSVAYRNSYPNQYDSIYYFLDKALEYKRGFKPVDIELEISVYELFAEVHFAQKNYRQAEKDAQYVLSLLEQVNEHNSVVTEYTEIYKFLVMYYETMNRPEEALKYHKLLLENEKSGTTTIKLPQWTICW